MPPSDATSATGFDLTLNGRTVRVEGASPTTTLLDWLRSSGRTGSKCGCAEGDCGACTVALVDRNAAGQPTYRAVNSCIALLPMFADREVVTVEGLADGPQLHPVQQAMVDHYGSQCGYCTPGFVVSMFEAYYRDQCQESWQISDQLSGNLCRCTGYRPIRDAAIAALAQRNVGSALAPTSPAQTGHGHEVGASADPTVDPFAERLKAPLAAPTELDYSAASAKFLRPTSLAGLFELLAKNPKAQLVAGATEIGVELNKKFKPFPLLISTEGVPELTRITKTDAAWRIGAAVTLTNVEEAVSAEYPSLAKMLRVFASRQIRNRATFGGNLVTASPIGDSAPVLLSLDASVVLATATSERTVPLADFFSLP